MRYCNHCHRITSGEPLYCNFCGRSYHFKLCPHHHPNPRNAEICSQCGFRELSTPHPRVPLWLSPIVALVSVLPGLILLGITILFFLAVIQALVQNQQLMFQLVVVGLMLSFLWYLYMHFPAFVRHFISKLFTRSDRDRHGH